MNKNQIKNYSKKAIVRILYPNPFEIKEFNFDYNGFLNMKFEDIYTADIENLPIIKIKDFSKIINDLINVEESNKIALQILESFCYKMNKLIRNNELKICVVDDILKMFYDSIIDLINSKYYLKPKDKKILVDYFKSQITWAKK